jgi:hypothetical protein
MRFADTRRRETISNQGRANMMEDEDGAVV